MFAGVGFFRQGVEGRVARVGWIGNSSARRYPRVFPGPPLSRFTSVLSCRDVDTIGEGVCGRRLCT